MKKNLSRLKVYLLGVWKMYCRFEQYLYVRCGFTRAARGNFPSHIIGGTSGLEVGRRDPSFWAGFGANIDAIEVTSLPNMAFCFVQIPLLIMTSFFVGKLKVQFNQKSVPPS